MKILFVDHEFHKKTHSSKFFLDLLKRQFSVEILYIDTETQGSIAALDNQRQHDIVILWQLDFLAPAFLAAGYPTVVVPMYDGSANLPHEHWIALNGASFINFSRTLHERALAAGARSLLVKYFLAPSPESQLAEFDELRGFLWMRKPEDGITPRSIGQMLGSQLSTLHVHNAPDDQQPRLLTEDLYRVTTFPLTESRWGADSSKYLSALGGSNIFFAPRPSEGIGMAMLEALARGQLVIANDEPVHTEYISNWTNGILYNRSHVGPFDLTKQAAREIAYTGWCGAVDGYHEWLDTASLIPDFVRETSAPENHNSLNNHRFLTALWDAYLLGIAPYRHFLREHVIFENTSLIAKAIPTVRKLVEKTNSSALDVDASGLFFGTAPRSVCSKWGFNSFDAFSASLGSACAGFTIANPPQRNGSTINLLSIKCDLLSAAKHWKVLIHINQELLLQQTLPLTTGPFLLDVPVPISEEKDLTVMLTFLSLANLDKNALPDLSFFSVSLQHIVSEELAVIQNHQEGRI